MCCTARQMNGYKTSGNIEPLSKIIKEFCQPITEFINENIEVIRVLLRKIHTVAFEICYLRLLCHMSLSLASFIMS